MSRVVVIGGGLGGAASAARLAKLGHSVTLVERRDRLGGAIGFVERDGYRWDTGPTWTALPAVLRDLFRKSGRPLERELELVPVQPMREHRFPDGSSLPLPSGSRAAQFEAIEEHLAVGVGDQWLDYTRRFAEPWDILRRNVFEQSAPGHMASEAASLLRTRQSLQGIVARTLRDRRLQEVALSVARLNGHDPRRVPSWMGIVSYLEQSFGTWTVPGGMGALAALLSRRLAERKVDVVLSTAVRDIVVRSGRPVGVLTDSGVIDGDVVVCAVDPRQLPSLAGYVRRTRPAALPTITHVGLRQDLPDLPAEVVLHGKPMVILRTSTSSQDHPAWTVISHGNPLSDAVGVLAQHGVDIRGNIEVQVTRTPSELLQDWGGSPYGTSWQGRRTLRRQLSTSTPLPGVYCAGASATSGPGMAFVGLSATLVAAEIGPLDQRPR